MRLDSGLWGPLGTLPDESPIHGEQREYGETYAPYLTRNEWIDANIRRQHELLKQLLRRGAGER